MKDTPIGMLMELVKTRGACCIRYEIDTPKGKLSTRNESSIVMFSDSIGETQVDDRALADAIRKRCKG